MTNDRIKSLFMWLAVALYIGIAVAWAGIAPAVNAAVPASVSAVGAVLNNPNTWSFIGWESIFILGALTVRAIVIRLTEPTL
jgi:hypothetical protein